VPATCPLPLRGDLVANRIRKGDITLFRRVCVDSGGQSGAVPIRAIRSASWRATGRRGVPVWRRSCLCRGRHNHDYADIRVMPTSVLESLRGNAIAVLKSAQSLGFPGRR
jgi:hypothetical protein